MASVLLKQEIQQNLLTSPQYLMDMPLLIDLHRMKKRVMCAWLCEIPYSMYSGKKVLDVHWVLSKSEALRYLTELILINERNKSNLSLVTE